MSVPPPPPQLPKTLADFLEAQLADRGGGVTVEGDSPGRRDAVRRAPGGGAAATADIAGGGATGGRRGDAAGGRKGWKKLPSLPPFAIRVAAFAGIAAVGVVVLIASRKDNETAPAAVPVAAVPAAPEEPGAFDGAFSRRASRQRLAPPVHLTPPYDVTDATTIVAEGGRVVLAYVTGIARDGVCIGSDGRRFACGLMGRASLQNHIRDLDVTCMPAFYPGQEMRYRCMAAGIDLGAFQVAAGFARPDGAGISFYARYLAGAVAEAAGAWNGGWTVWDPTRQPAPSLPAERPAGGKVPKQPAGTAGGTSGAQ
ncbi:MAG: hypothetical protein R3D02_02130 [Hyphomicrobiales bacterium]